MKKQLISMGCLLMFFSAACFSQHDTSSSYKWEVGVKMNSRKNNIWDPFEVDGLNIKNLGWYNGTTIPGSNWGNGIMIANHGTLIFDGDRGNVPANRDFFMAHPTIAGP